MAHIFSDLRAQLGPGKVLCDQAALTAYSVDASIYRLRPQAIVLIESSSDLEITLAFANSNQIPLTARSGGTNLTGNAVGKGIILEFSRLKKILSLQGSSLQSSSLNEEEGAARVEPGMVYAELNRRLAGKGWMFAPDPSSGDMCKLGGMWGNNAAGPHTLKYGATKDNVLKMEILLANGKWITAKDYRLDDPDLVALFDENPALKSVYELVVQNKDLIQSKKIGVSKNSSGYNLFDLADGLDRGIFPLHQLFIGSEGTLGLTREATIRLVPKPAEQATVLIYLQSLSDVGPAVQDLRRLSPSALEMMDANSLDLVGREKFAIPKEAEVMLLAEFDEDIHSKIDKALSLLDKVALCVPVDIAFDPERQEALWRVRKAMYPTLYKFNRDKKPINFADDVVVAAERIPELVDYLEQLFLEKGVAVAIYGHIGDGNAHINPLLDIHDEADFETMVALSHEIHHTVIERFGGSICGEHGDGRVRAEFLRALYGPELYGLFKGVKHLMDPDQILNPGVKITETPFTEHIDRDLHWKQCASCGKCNSVCPVYDVVGEESNSARGWFHILTAPDYNYAESSRIVEACINCKSCRPVCPAGLDVSELILEKRAAHPNELAGKFFHFQAEHPLFEKALKIAALTEPLWNHRIGRKVIEGLSRSCMKALGPNARIPADMILPRLAKKHLRERHAELIDLQSTIAYFHGCAANYFDDGVGDAVIGLLRQSGVEVALPPQSCSGTPIQTYGLQDLVRENARFNIDSFKSYETVITGCASCTLMLKDYPKLFKDETYYLKAMVLAGKVQHISEFILNKQKDQKNIEHQRGNKFTRLTYHASCHLRAAGGGEAPKKLLRNRPDIDFIEMPDADRCAGGAGSFCLKNPEQSAKIFERKRAGIQETGADVVVTSCPACMIQLNNGLKGKVTVKHIAQVLLET